MSSVPIQVTVRVTDELKKLVKEARESSGLGESDLLTEAVRFCCPSKRYPPRARRADKDRIQPKIPSFLTKSAQVVSEELASVVTNKRRTLRAVYTEALCRYLFFKQDELQLDPTLVTTATGYSAKKPAPGPDADAFTAAWEVLAADAEDAKNLVNALIVTPLLAKSASGMSSKQLADRSTALIDAYETNLDGKPVLASLLASRERQGKADRVAGHFIRKAIEDYPVAGDVREAIVAYWLVETMDLSV